MKSLLIRMLAVIALSFVAASPVLAQWMGDRGGDGFYVGGGLGPTYLKLDTEGLIGSSDEKDTGWKAFAGYQINRYVGVEVGYYDLGKAGFGGRLATFPGSAVNLGLKSKAYAFSAVGNLPLGGSGFSLLARVGVARADTDADVMVGAGPTVTLSEESTEITYGLGVRYDFTRALAVRAEWERFRIGGSGIGDKSDVDLFTVNAFYRF